MSNNGKQLSNSYSTGGGGTHFENRIQASFVVLMLTGGFSPCLPTWPINEIKLQGKYQGFDTDDLIVFVKQPGSERQAKLLGQIKHSINITNRDKVFGEVIQAAWKDFNNKEVFNEGTDVLALITGPLSSADTVYVRGLLNQAHYSKNASDFIKRVSMANFTSEGQRKKLEVFRNHLKYANNNSEVMDEVLWRFLKCFNLLLYDLDIKGVTLSLLHTLIGQYSQQRAEDLLALIEKEVSHKSENASYISMDSIPENILSAFWETEKRTIPAELVKFPVDSIPRDWSTHEMAPKLVPANLLGSWDEKRQGDAKILSQFVGGELSEWIAHLRELLQFSDSPIDLKNGIWSISQRQELWGLLGKRIFDNTLETFKNCAITVLSERDPKFTLPLEKRFASSLYGKEFAFSTSLRKGIADSLALLGSNQGDFIHCTVKPETIAHQVVKQIFTDSDWQLWGSLNDLLPILAEAAPEQFLKAVEDGLKQDPSPIDELFSQESNSLIGGNYLTGLLWALETLAWDEQFLVSVTVILGEIASRDPGGNWANRPAKSLTTIFLPWFPQTMASIEKRDVAVKTLQREVPLVGWKLLISLLPKQTQTSIGSHKPNWRMGIAKDLKVSGKNYWLQVSNYSELAIEMSTNDTVKLAELVGYLDNLPPKSFERVLEILSSKDISSKPEDERFTIWSELIKVAAKHRRFSDAEWALNIELVEKIDEAALTLAPLNPLYRHRILFNNREMNLYEGKGNWREQGEELEQRRQSAITEIVDFGGIEAVLDFSKTVENPFLVGFSFGIISEDATDLRIIPDLLNSTDNTLTQFTCAYVRARFRIGEWDWVDSINKNGWSHKQIGQFLAWLPFNKNTWERVELLLGKSEKEYWQLVDAYPYEADMELEAAINKLLIFKRPNAAINCLYSLANNNFTIENKIIIEALLAATNSTEPSFSLDTYHNVELIKLLQKDPDTNPDDLFKIEWAYLPILDGNYGVTPEFLENSLACDPDFFSEVIRVVYRSKKEKQHESTRTEQQQSLAMNAYKLLEEWRIPPGKKRDGSFSEDEFNKWLERAKVICKETGHIDVALSHIGRVLFYSPADHSGLWINKVVATALNSKEGEIMRSGFSLEVLNSRGAHFIDPNGKPEKELASKFRNKAEEVENAGFHRFANTLRGIADSYNHEAERIIKEHVSQID